MSPINRRQFLQQALAAAGGLTLARPLQALAARAQSGIPTGSPGYDELVDMGDLWLPRGFQYRIISTQGEPMSDGNPTPGIFDGMGAFDGPVGTTILLRNHENTRNARGTGEIAVVVPEQKRYDAHPTFNANAGVTKLVVGSNRRLVESYAVLGGTSTNCAGGVMPWGSWVTCEEIFESGAKPHGYAFEIDADANGPVDPEPIRSAGRFFHEAVVWHDCVLYQTEHRPDAAFYRYLPDPTPRRPADLARTTGPLQALRVVGHPRAATKAGWPVGQAFAVDWVTIDSPEPATNDAPASTRAQAQARGAAMFSNSEGMWLGGRKVYFDATTGGTVVDAAGNGWGQIWEFDPVGQTLTLVYESPGQSELKRPDNMTFTPVGDLLLCEDSDIYPERLHRLTPEGRLYEFARSKSNDMEFAGACFDPRGETLFVNQMGNRPSDAPKPVFPGVTYAIWGPWKRQGQPAS